MYNVHLSIVNIKFFMNKFKFKLNYYIDIWVLNIYNDLILLHFKLNKHVSSVVYYKTMLLLYLCIIR